MYVETWPHFRTVLNNVKGVLSPSDKRICEQVINWSGKLLSYYTGINESEITEVGNWIKSIIVNFAGQSSVDLTNCYVFLSRLNEQYPASYFKTQQGCAARGYYWYDAACHLNPKPPEPLPTPPKPEPIPVPPIPITPPPPPLPLPLPIPAGLEQLLEQVEAFYESIPIGQIIKKGIVLLARNWLRAIVSFQQFISGRGK